MDKAALKAELQESRDALQAELHGLSEEAYFEEGVAGDWCLKDVLAHINRWEGELVTMLWDLKNGKRPARFDIEGMDDVDRMNAQWYREDKDRALKLVRDDFRALRKQTIRRVEAFTEEELSDPQAFDGLRGEPLWRWVAVDTYEHEREHLEAVRSWRRSRQSE
jgi:hypothetical protein